MIVKMGTNIKKWIAVIASRPPRMIPSVSREVLMGFWGEAAKLATIPAVQIRPMMTTAKIVTGLFLSINSLSCRTSCSPDQ